MTFGTFKGYLHTEFLSISTGSCGCGWYIVTLEQLISKGCITELWIHSSLKDRKIHISVSVHQILQNHNPTDYPTSCNIINITSINSPALHHIWDHRYNIFTWCDLFLPSRLVPSTAPLRLQYMRCECCNNSLMWFSLYKRKQNCWVDENGVTT